MPIWRSSNILPIFMIADDMTMEMIQGTGGRAGIFAKKNRELFDLSDTQFKQLVRAVSGHTDAMPGCKAGDDPTMAVCWDSDRLDIDRVGLVVDPMYLFTDLGRELAYLKHENEEH